MTEEEIIKIAISEFNTPTLGVTEQYLEIHSPVMENGAIKIDRVDFVDESDIGIVYVPVVDEYFHFAIYVDSNNQEVLEFATESWNRVYFKATSEEFSIKKLKTVTRLSPTEFWNRGDWRKNGESRYRFSCFKLLAHSEPDEFEDKLKNLLDILETDSYGIKKLTECTNASITVAMNFHNGNGTLGGMNIDAQSIKRMSKLNLSIDFDLYADGNKFQE